MVRSLVSITFDGPQLSIHLKQNIYLLEKGLVIVSLPQFVYDFSRKNVSHVTFY